MSYATIEDLRSQLGAQPVPPDRQAYVAKMWHALPEATTVDRAAFILDHVRGKRVLEFGATGPMHEAIVKVAEYVHGVDREDAPGVIGFDLDDVERQMVPSFCEGGRGPDVIVCGEVLEHLSNPGWFLTRLRRQCAGVPVVITVPNAFTSIGRGLLAKGIENVNADHVAWYSPRTLRVLLERVGYGIRTFHYYNGHGPTAEGLIVVTE